MKEIIRHFDENLCDKISKSNMMEFKAKLENKFLSHEQNDAITRERAQYSKDLEKKVSYV